MSKIFLDFVYGWEIV